MCSWQRFLPRRGAAQPFARAGPPPARHLARKALTVIIRLAGQAPYRRRPLGSNVEAPQSALLLVSLTTTRGVGIIPNMKATLVARRRIVYAERAFAELALWRVPAPVVGSSHEFKYRLAYFVDGICVVRYDNEVGKGDHRHFGNRESAYSFTTPEALLAAFERDIARWNRENSDS